jgi:ATP-binding cassette, subfamily B, bacterial
MGVIRLLGGLLRLVRPWRGIALFTLCTMIAEAAIELLLRLSFKVLIDDAIGAQNRRLLTLVLLAMVLGAIASSLVGLLQDYLNAKLETLVLCELRQRMFERLQSLSMAFHAKADAGEILTRFTADLATIETALYTCLGAGGITAVLMVVGGLPPLFWLDWRLGLIVVAGLPILVASSLGLAPRVTEASREVQEAQAEVLGRVQESLLARATVKVFRLETHEKERFARVLASYFTKAQRSNLLGYAVYRGPNAVVAILGVVVLAVGAELVLSGELGLGALISYHVTLTQLMSAVRDLSSRAPTLFRSAASLERVEALLATEPTVLSPPTPAPFPEAPGAIRFEEVTMAYDAAHPTLESVSFEIPWGQSVAFVGASGSGKSTALAMLLRFYDPLAGAVKIGECDLRSFSLEGLRREVTAVFQDNFLFNGSIQENIRMGRLDATEAEIHEAARLAEVHEAILAMPAGYGTSVGERGSNLSGGQRQRIAIARAILSRPRVLLLDEATSALDPVTEAALNETLGRLNRGRTVIAVTHRLRSATTADRIFVFGGGRLVESGTHAALLEQRGVYHRLWQKQDGLGVDGAPITPARIASIPIFAGVDVDVLPLLAPLFVTEHYGPGAEIIREGETGDRFYVVARGSVVIERDGAALARLEDGDHFGEVALLREAPRNATVRSVADTTVLSLRRDQFLAIVDFAPEVRAELERASSSRA